MSSMNIGHFIEIRFIILMCLLLLAAASGAALTTRFWYIGVLCLSLVGFLSDWVLEH